MSSTRTHLQDSTTRIQAESNMLDLSLATSALTDSLNLASLDELDPSLAEDFKLFCEREAPLEIRTQDGNNLAEAGSVEAIRFRVLIRGAQSELEAVRVELTSESDLFFHYTHTIGQDAFQLRMQQEQKLMVDFEEYPSMFLRLLNNCIQNMEYKFVELLSCRFHASDEERVKQQLTFRYNAVKSRLALMQARLADINAVVKLKNPSLLLQLQSVPPRMPGLSSSLLSISDGLSSPQKTLLTSLKRSPSSATSPQNTLLTSLHRSPSSVRGSMQNSGKNPSQKEMPWAY